ncbi:type IV pilin protein [Paraglaciecola hydrolytica]|uniref:Pilus assembly protein PilE n=1 Tax=Paraglaciecola hydrolytica TaxID=1799789 RepID=A0A148KLP9_9ALTE|nr:type IV pilin protein [Paraglaciecola hydrolytica]KXI27189.1 pilus assembly protein PilE [Paraglaciecola hydrolytica]
MAWQLRHEDIFTRVKLSGMTLIELMVVVAIVAILAIVVYPTFEGHIIKSRRNDGATQLLRIKLQQESYRLNHPSYATSSQLTLPVSDYYDFSIVNISASTYTIVALAKGSQQTDSACQTLAIDQSMNKTPAHCW